MPDAAPLHGLLVADFSRVLAGPYATMMLADLGATVIKVERPGVGDETRGWGPPWAGELSSYFVSVNRGKRSVVLDLGSPGGLTEARELARRADILVENFRPGFMDAIGLGYDSLAAENSKLVYCSISGFGTSGGAELPGYDFIVQAVGGLMSITGEASGEPTKTGVALVDVLTGKDAVVGILAALRELDSTGRGQRVQVALLSSLLGSLVNQLSGALSTGHDPARMGNRHPSIAPYETLRCSDGELAVAVGNDDQFRRLAVALELPGLADDPRYRRNSDRVANRDELVVALEIALRKDTAEAWQHRLGRARIAAGAVKGVVEAIAFAEELGLEPTWDPGGGALPQASHPIRYSHIRPIRSSAPPVLGADTDAVRSWLAEPTSQKIATQEVRS